MITPTKLKYRHFHILIIRHRFTATVHWHNPAIDYIGYQQVNSRQWSDGELFRFAMDAIDTIWSHIDRVEYQSLTGRGQP